MPKPRRVSRDYDVADLGLAKVGAERIEWADLQMPVLRKIRERFAKDLPLKGLKMSACLHITAETGNLLRALKAGGAHCHAHAHPIRSRPRMTSRPRWSANTTSRVTRFTARIATPTTAICARCSRAIRTSRWMTAPTSSACCIPNSRSRRPKCAPAWRKPPPASSACARWKKTARCASRWSRSMTRKPSSCSTIATAPASPPSRRSCARPESSLRDQPLSSRATDGAGVASRHARMASAPPSS